LYNPEATNESGFSALPGGERNSYGEFTYMIYFANFWTSAEQGTYTGYARSLPYNSGLESHFYDNKIFGYSVRCIKD